VASDVIAQKYFRKAGVPARLKPVKEKGVPEFLWRSCGRRGGAGGDCPRTQRYGGETSAKQVFDRLAGAWAYWGWKGGYFSSRGGRARLFRRDALMLARQMAAPNSPQWFNTGLHWAYGIDGPSQGHFYVDYKTGKLTKSKSAYEHPQPHACFIQSVADDLVNEGGIMDLWVREARLFKYGSGTGTNFSSLRAEGEKLSGGGKSSGLMGFPEDRRPRRRRDQVGRHDAARGQDGDRATPTTRTSRSSSTGRSWKSRRWRASSPAPRCTSARSTRSSTRSAWDGDRRTPPTRPRTALKKAIRAAKKAAIPRPTSTACCTMRGRATRDRVPDL
jgi:ribonucleoside-diphosphate reductase alpha chain